MSVRYHYGLSEFSNCRISICLHILCKMKMSGVHQLFRKFYRTTNPLPISKALNRNNWQPIFDRLKRSKFFTILIRRPHNGPYCLVVLKFLRKTHHHSIYKVAKAMILRWSRMLPVITAMHMFPKPAKERPLSFSSLKTITVA